MPSSFCSALLHAEYQQDCDCQFVAEKFKKHDINQLLFISGLIGLALLIVFAFAGKFILSDVFQIDINALLVVGGIKITARW